MNCKYYDEENCSCGLLSGNPTYLELYEYWLKTKDKPKRKRKSDPPPDQLNLFDVIDNTKLLEENNND